MTPRETSPEELSSLGIRLPPRRDPEDYYFEGGVMIFTAHYLLKRGQCCGCGCRHCPYDANGQPLPQFASAAPAGVPAG